MIRSKKTIEKKLYFVNKSVTKSHSVDMWYPILVFCTKQHLYFTILQSGGYVASENSSIEEDPHRSTAEF